MTTAALAAVPTSFVAGPPLRPRDQSVAPARGPTVASLAGILADAPVAREARERRASVVLPMG